jgi:hypothetical protein
MGKVQARRIKVLPMQGRPVTWVAQMRYPKRLGKAQTIISKGNL